jgi:hypothetical protein
MIEVIQGLPENVVGVEGVGEVSAEDYKSVLIPAAEERLRATVRDHRRRRAGRPGRLPGPAATTKRRPSAQIMLSRLDPGTRP